MSGAKEQVTRLLALAPYLQAHRSVRLQELADAFSVSTTQMIKDLNVLYYCGLPGLAGGQLMEINFEAFENDPEGMVNLDNADYLNRPLRLGSSEAAALMVALKALREGSNPESAALIDSALTKIEDATSTGASDAVHVQLPTRSADQDSFRTELRHAITTKTQASIDYYVPSRDETTRRVVDPIALFTKDGSEYLDAWCHQAGGRRTFRLSRIRAVTGSDRPITAPDTTPRDLAAGLFEAGPEDLSATLWVSPENRWLADYYPVESTEEADDGALLVTLKAGDVRWLLRLVMRLAPGVRILSPADLGEQVARIATTTKALYAGSGRTA